MTALLALFFTNLLNIVAANFIYLMKKITGFFTLLFILFIQPAFAQGPGDPGGGDDGDIPIDGGISLLLVAGVAYGSKKVLDYRKANPKL
jgi:hypothetical protein